MSSIRNVRRLGFGASNGCRRDTRTAVSMMTTVAVTTILNKSAQMMDIATYDGRGYVTGILANGRNEADIKFQYGQSVARS